MGDGQLVGGQRGSADAHTYHFPSGPRVLSMVILLPFSA